MSSTVLVPHMANTFGWSYGAIGLGFSIQWALSGLLSPVSGWLGDRYGVRKIMLCGALLFIIGMVLTGFVTQLWHFYLTFGLILSAAMAVFQVPLVAAVTLWFKRHLGTGMGILQSSQGIGPVILAPLTLIILKNYGWNWALWLPGIIGGIILLVLVRFFYNEPADIGLKPFGADELDSIQQLQKGHVAKARTQVFFKSRAPYERFLESHKYPLLGLCGTQHNPYFPCRYSGRTGSSRSCSRWCPRHSGT